MQGNIFILSHGTSSTKTVSDEVTQKRPSVGSKPVSGFYEPSRFCEIVNVSDA